MMHVSKFVINLKDRTDRRVEMQRQLDLVRWQASFIDSDRPTDIAGFPSVGARGCFINHLETLKRASVRKAHVLLMEDDLNFTAEFSRSWEEALNGLETKDWSIFYPAHSLKGQPYGLNQIAPTTGVMGSHFLMINSKAVSTIITGLEEIVSRPPGHPLGGPMHVDGAYSNIRNYHPELKTFTFDPSLGYQRSSRSDVAEVRLFDRISSLKPIMTILRRIKQKTDSR